MTFVIFSIIIIICVIIIFQNISSMLKTKKTFQNIANRLNLRYYDGSPGSVNGRIDDYSISLVTYRKGSGKNTHIRTQIKISFPTSLRLGLRLRRQNFWDNVGSMILKGDIETGDPEFDKICYLSGRSADKINEFLTEKRRLLIKQLLENHLYVDLEDSLLEVQFTGMVANEDVLYNSITQMLNLSKVLIEDSNQIAKSTKIMELSDPMDLSIPLAAESAQPLDSSVSLAAESAKPLDSSVSLDAESAQPLDSSVSLDAESAQPLDSSVSSAAESAQPLDSSVSLDAESAKPLDSSVSSDSESAKPLDSSVSLDAESATTNCDLLDLSRQIFDGDPFGSELDRRVLLWASKKICFVAIPNAVNSHYVMGKGSVPTLQFKIGEIPSKFGSPSELKASVLVMDGSEAQKWLNQKVQITGLLRKAEGFSKTIYIDSNLIQQLD